MAAKTELAPLTGLRFVAAFSILCMHAIVWCIPFRNFQIPQHIGAWVGVYGMPLFFVLSGFVIHYNYGILFRKQPYGGAVRDFLSARFARIYPLFVFFCIFGIVSDFTVNWIEVSPRYFLSYVAHSVTLTQSWVYKIVVNNRLLASNGFGLAWSLSCEFFFYLAYIFFLFAILPLRRPLHSIIVIAIYSIAVFSVLWFARLHADELMSFASQHVNHYISPQDDFQNSLYRWFFYYSPYVRIWEFILGCLTAQLFLSIQDRPISSTERLFGLSLLWLAVALLLIYGFVYSTHRLGGLPGQFIDFFSLNYGCAVPLAIVIFGVARYRSWLSALLSLPWIVWLGDISFSIYAVHTWTVRPFIRPAVDINVAYGIDAIFRIVMAIAFTVIVAAATYVIIEVPCRRYLRAKLMRHDRRATRDVPAESAAAPMQA